VDDVEAELGQPEEEEVRCEALEALLTLLAEDRDCQRDFMRRGGVAAVAAYLLPWLEAGQHRAEQERAGVEEEEEEPPSELVSRAIVFLGVLVRHILPGGGGGGGAALAAEAEVGTDAYCSPHHTMSVESRNAGLQRGG